MLAVLEAVASPARPQRERSRTQRAVRSLVKNLKIGAKKLAVAANPYYLNRRHTLQAEIRALIRALRPMQTEHPLIRIGEGADGGYLVPDDLNGIAACFSPGVSNLLLFERHLQERHGIRSLLCDASVDRPTVDFEFAFDKKFVGAYNNGTFMTMDAWHDRYCNWAKDSDLILQMDIEGAEYATLLATSDALLAKFRIIVIECHHLFKMLDYVTFPLIHGTFAKLLQTHICVHAHPNNNQGSITIGDIEIPDVLEMAFLRKDRARYVRPATTFPHPLDRDVDPERRPLVLPPCWYQ
jgi:Methyltransferase FkbM domain